MISITTGVLIVYFTGSKIIIRNCQLNFTKTVQNPVDYNSDPRSVAIGDFNNDSWLDFVVTYRALNNISVVLGSANSTFKQSTIYSTGAHSLPDKVVVADLNNDERLDIIVACLGINSVGIFLGTGDGTFVSHTMLFTGSSRPIWIHIAHLDEDAFLDLVTVDYGTESITLFSGNGTGNFSYRMRYPTGYDSSPVSVISADLNNDNHLDLIVANSGTNNVGIFFGKDNGKFSQQNLLSTGIHSRPNSIVAGYFNNDTLLELAVANYGTNSIGVLRNTGNGTFAEQITYILENASPYFIHVTNINKDERSDLIAINNGANNIAVLLGRANDTFSRPIMFAIGSSSISAAIDDLNKDGLPDIVVINDHLDSITIFSSEKESFQPGNRYSYNIESDINQKVAIDDTTRSNRIDTSSKNKKIQARHSFDSGICSEPIHFEILSNPFTFSFDDFNNDGYSDIILASFERKEFGIFLGYGNGSFTYESIYEMDHSLLKLELGDFNGDAYLDIVVLTYDESAYDNLYLDVLQGYGNGSFAKRQTYRMDSVGTALMEVKDFNNDNLLDILLVDSYGNLSVLPGIGNGSFAKREIYQTDLDMVSLLVVEDFNEDKLLDVVIVNFPGTMSILLGIGNGLFSKPTAYPIIDNPKSIIVGDFNNDTISDFLFISYTYFYDAIGVLIGYGNGMFANQTIYTTAFHPQAIAVGDFNNDAIPDVVVVSCIWDFTESDFNVSVLLGFGNGSFHDLLTIVTGKGRLYATVADFNNDHRMDIVVVNAYDSTMRLFSGYGNGSFAESSTLSTGLAPVLVMVADINDDSRSDIVVAHYQGDDISVYIFNLIDFATQSISFGLSDASRLQCIATGDFNSDNILDIVIVNSGTQNIALLLGRGDGSFIREAVVPLDWNSNPQSIAIADYNKDNQLDLAVANSGTLNIDMFLGNGKGALIRQNNDGYNLDRPLSIIVADDFNHDGHSEIVVAYNNSDNIDILVVYDPGSFTDQMTYSFDLRSNSVAMGDFNRDGILDVVAAISFDDKIAILLGHGDGSFTNQTTYAIDFSSQFVAIGHFNNDSYLDVVVTNDQDITIGILCGYGNGSFAEEKTYSAGSSPDFVALSDFNNDTFWDIVVLSRNSNIIRVLLNDGNGSFTEPQLLQTQDWIDSLAIGDVNNDMFMDILVSDFDNQTNVFFGYGNGSFGMLARSSIGNRASFITVGNFNNDVWLDIVFINDDDKVDIRLGYGNGSFANHTTYSVGCSPYDVTVADLNNDDQLDIVVSHWRGNNITVLLGDGNGFFTGLAKYRTVTSRNSLVVGDFNNDTKMDIFVTSSVVSTISILLGTFNQVFKHQISLTAGTGSSPRALATGDFNNDAHPDIVVVNSGTTNLGVFLGHGNGFFSTQILSSTISNSSLIAVGHFDNDVHLDVVVVCFNEDAIDIHLGWGNGSFFHHATYSTGVHARPKSVSVADFNNDAILDIIIVNSDASNVLVFLGHGNGYFQQATEIQIGYGAYPFSVAVADYNDDKKLDFAIANYGSDNLEIYLQNCKFT